MVFWQVGVKSSGDGQLRDGEAYSFKLFKMGFTLLYSRSWRFKYSRTTRTTKKDRVARPCAWRYAAPCPRVRHPVCHPFCRTTLLRNKKNKDTKKTKREKEETDQQEEAGQRRNKKVVDLPFWSQYWRQFFGRLYFLLASKHWSTGSWFVRCLTDGALAATTTN